MNLLTDENELVGKVIKEAKINLLKEDLALVFEDGTYAVVSASAFGCNYELRLNTDISEAVLAEFGLLTDAEKEGTIDFDDMLYISLL